MGFEKYSKYIIPHFAYINENLGDSQKGLYYRRWFDIYEKIFKEDDKNILEWNVRLRKTTKSIITSAAFFKEAERAKMNHMWTSYYYLNYYSLFHALLSCVYLLPNLKIKYLSNIQHAKLLNNFCNEFTPNKNPIISFDVKNYFEALKYLREYYSYNMPMNSHLTINEFKMMKIDDLEKLILQCFQVANLHSLILENSCSKAILASELEEEDIYNFIELYKLANSRVNPVNGKTYLDVADKNAMYERLSQGFEILLISLDLEHDEDEFRTYSGDEGEIGTFEVFGLVRKAL